MSIKFEWFNAYTESNVAANQRAVMYALWKCADAQTLECYPKIETLAGWVNLGDRSVINQINQNEMLGWVKRLSRGYTGHPTQYRLTFGADEIADLSDRRLKSTAQTRVKPTSDVRSPGTQHMKSTSGVMMQSTTGLGEAGFTPIDHEYIISEDQEQGNKFSNLGSVDELREELADEHRNDKGPDLIRREDWQGSAKSVEQAKALRLDHDEAISKWRVRPSKNFNRGNDLLFDIDFKVFLKKLAAERAAIKPVLA